MARPSIWYTKVHKSISKFNISRPYSAIRPPRRLPIQQGVERISSPPRSRMGQLLGISGTALRPAEYRSLVHKKMCNPTCKLDKLN